MSIQHALHIGRRLLCLVALISLFASLSLLAVLPAQAASIVVNTLADEETNNATCSLREAIVSANIDTSYNSCSGGSGADLITFSVSGEILLTNNLPHLASEMTIDGGGSITLNGGHGSQILVNSSEPVTLRNLTMIRGYGTGVGNRVGSGAIDNDNTTLIIINSTISNSSSKYSGGGIYNYFGNLTLINSTISGNYASDGGGIYNEGGTLTLTNSTVSGNWADHIATYPDAGSTANNHLGGGIYNEGGTLTLTNSTISRNSAGRGGGLYIASGTVTLGNTIIANSTSGGDCFNSGGSITTSGRKLIEDGSCAIPGALTGDPMLGTLTGDPAYFPLLYSSPAIDSGDNSICPPTDQRGAVRPQEGDGKGGAVCDLGAYEKHPPLDDTRPQPTDTPEFIPFPPTHEPIQVTLVRPPFDLITVTPSPTEPPVYNLAPTNQPASSDTPTVAQTVTAMPTIAPSATPTATNTPAIKATDPPIIITDTPELG